MRKKINREHEGIGNEFGCAGQYSATYEELLESESAQACIVVTRYDYKIDFFLSCVLLDSSFGVFCKKKNSYLCMMFCIFSAIL